MYSSGTHLLDTDSGSTPPASGMGVKMATNVRVGLRLSATTAMLLSSAIGGFLWAQNLTSKQGVIAAAVATTISLVMALVVEEMAVRSATKLAFVSTLLAKADRDHFDSNEKARGLDLIVAMLSEENSELRAARLTDKVREMDGIRRSKFEVI
jgi:hypothetical protein